MLNTRTAAILRELMRSEAPMTSEYLAKLIGVTSRTIRNDIKELNAYILESGASIHSIRGTGFQLEIEDSGKFRKLLQEIVKDEAEETPSLPKDRIHYLLKRLLLAKGYSKLDDIADEMFVSKSTLNNDLRDVKEILHAYGITLEKRPNFGLRCKGEEFKIRLCIADHVFNTFEIDFDPKTVGIESITKEDITAIRSTILKNIEEHGITISDIGLSNLLIHIAIAITRIQNKNYVNVISAELDDLKERKQYKVAEEIVFSLEKIYSIQFPAAEIAYITIHLLGTKIISELHFSEQDMQGMMDSCLYLLINQIVGRINEELHIGINHDKELFIAMSLHLKPALNRSRYGINLPNPYLNDIKSNYPLAFQAAVIAGAVIKQELNMEINEHEIGYLSLHIGAAMERRQKGIKRCMIVCASGVGSARLLESKIHSAFPREIEIAGTTPYYNLPKAELSEIDFIISTVPVPYDLPVPVIQVNTILGESDLDKIESTLKERSSHAIFYLRKPLVFLNQDFQERDEVLRFLSSNLYAAGFVTEDYLNAVLEREALSPTSYGNLVAIPHPMTPQTEESFWTICTLRNPIDWGGNRVQFVCLLNVGRNSSDNLQDMYDMLIKIVDNSQLVQKAVKCKTYDQLSCLLAENIS
ncbi:BglG family transcription antiterminator [Metabacillus sp. GX 13764]|uniref:BglG family transcription antiterminator n=1 Tax=Metabacillus kandeliae TaxID=2900151 RepID=UPI001E4D4122|nr:BglG family transcription antiterminator [Metabacillus kandeliae]MCD7034548.1 BglG family transcription antiterminator [Metabacillus kandeliae]